VPGGPELGSAVEPVQPVYSRYWLHNRGPAPVGYLPVSVAVTPGRLATAGEPVTVDVALASQLLDADHEGVLRLVVPEGWTAEPAARVYRLPAGGWQRFTATVTPPAGAADGLYFLAARLDYAGNEVEDVATVVVGEPAPADTDGGDTAPGESTGPGRRATPGGLTVGVAEPELVLRPGGRGTVAVELTNTTRDEIRAEVRLVSPWGSWDAIPEVVRGVTVAAGGHLTVEFGVSVPADADPGHTWAIGKVLWFGRCQYTPTVHLVVAP
jgi:hypothetical protein